MNGAYVEGTIVQWTPGESHVLTRVYHPEHTVDTVRVVHPHHDVSVAFLLRQRVGFSGRLTHRRGSLCLLADSVFVEGVELEREEADIDI